MVFYQERLKHMGCDIVTAFSSFSFPPNLTGVDGTSLSEVAKLHTVFTQV